MKTFEEMGYPIILKQLALFLGAAVDKKTAAQTTEKCPNFNYPLVVILKYFLNYNS
jgi:hypothetical protein